MPLPWRLAHGLLRCTFAPLEGSWALGLPPQRLKKPQVKEPLFPLLFHPRVLTSSLGWRRRGLRKGISCPCLSPLPHSLSDLVHVYRGGPVNNPLPLMTKSSHWCPVPSLWPLCRERGGCRGKRWEGPSLILGMWRPARSCPAREGTVRRLKRSSTSCLTGSPGFPLDSLTCMYVALSLRCSASQLQTPRERFSTSTPLLNAQDSWALLSRTLLPRALP